MKAFRSLMFTAAVSLLVVGCASGTFPTWTARPSGSPAASPVATIGAGGAAGAPATDAPPSPNNEYASVIPSLAPKGSLEAVPAGEVNTAYAPNVPPAATRHDQAVVDVHFDVVEGVKAIDPNGTQYTTWGYRLHGDTSITTGTPGPMIRLRVGDVLRFTLTNDGTMPHNVDFHAVTGQGGGAKDLTVNPGESATIEARMLYPGIFMYHCAAGDVPDHISQGMYGGILVDPETPLPPVEHELYMVQSEYYTTKAADGSLATDRQAITDESPSYVVFNGAVGSLTGDNAPKMQVGERMRIYFVNAGLNLDSNFHPIGSHWDMVWEDGALLNAPLRGVQTTLVPAGGGTVVEIAAQVPHTIVLVDHALARAFDKGAIGQVVVTGDPNPEVYQGFPAATPAGSPASATAMPSNSPAAASPAPSTSAASAVPEASGGATIVSIVPGSGTYQTLNAPDEFTAAENPPDYSVNELMIPLGTTVTWTNDDPTMPHTVTDANGSFDSGLIQPGGSWSYTFDKPGDFEYFCTLHPWMRAKVSVMMH